MPPLMQLAERLRSGELRSRELVEQALARIAAPSGEGARTFLRVYAEHARVQADALDRLRAAGAALPPLAGIPVSIKDLFDVAGEVTTAGSRVLASSAPAREDAAVVTRLRTAGLIVLGRTNMTELAYSGLGINPHHGTPLNPFDRAGRRIPGGSSCGAAISVTDDMAAAALGTDTGGSCRIPAALTGLVGFKPTAERVPRAGVMPLSTTLDSVGPLGRTVECCALLDALLCGQAPSAPEAFPLAGLRLLAPQNYVLEGLEAPVARAFERSLSELSRRGAQITRAAFAGLERLSDINAKGGFSAAEAYARYRVPLETHLEQFDPRVALRILKGREQSAADYLELIDARRALCALAAATTAAFDATVMPTVPAIAPRLEELQSDASYFRANALMLRNPAIANFLDRCAVSVPMQQADEPPMGLMLMGEHGEDRRLLAIARAVEQAQRGLS
jgi:aspartyl-tRNA(Asn)/glutamyl-tRNA(Gln) amidotransferase subunit A